MDNKYEDIYEALEQVGLLMVQTLNATVKRPGIVVWGFLDEDGGSHVAASVAGQTEMQQSDLDSLAHNMTIHGLGRVTQGSEVTFNLSE